MVRLYFAGKDGGADGFAGAERTVAETCECRLWDASSVATASAADAIHLDTEAHGKLAASVLAEVEALIG